MEETLLDYLIRQKEEREQRVKEYREAETTYIAAKNHLESLGDITLVTVEISKLDRYIAEVAEREGAVETDTDSEGADENVVTYQS